MDSSKHKLTVINKIMYANIQINDKILISALYEKEEAKMGIFFKDAENPTGDDYDALDDFFLETELDPNIKQQGSSRKAWQNEMVYYKSNKQEA